MTLLNNPTVQTAILSIITAAAAYIVAWLQGRTKALAAAARGAVVEMEALTSEKRELSGPEKKAEAIARVMARMPKVDPVKVAEHVQEQWQLETQRPTTVPPPPPPPPPAVPTPVGGNPVPPPIPKA